MDRPLMTPAQLSCLLLVLLLAIAPAVSRGAAIEEAEVVVLAGFEQTRAWLAREQWWGEVKRGEQLSAPNVLITGISNRWRQTAATLPVSEKKEIFYRFLLPLILHANELVLRAREALEIAAEQLARGEAVAPALLQQLRDFAPILRIRSAEAAASIKAQGTETAAIIQEMLYKLDIIPAGLALGQAAYESGYGTSRFAAEGNALFGQWTFGGEGLRPEQQRKSLGDHRIAAFDWPFDSVRSYFINLMSHPAYEPFRALRASRRREDKPLGSLALADGLTSYSERGQAYVDTLKSIIRVNRLDLADTAVLRAEPRRFIVGAEDATDAARLRDEIAALRRSGELAVIIERMNLD